MKLTGKCKKDFEKWLRGNLKPNALYTLDMKTQILSLTDFDFHHFNQLSDSMKYGVYVDFFDSVGMCLDVQPCGCHFPAIFTINIGSKDKSIQFIGTEEYETRAEARTKALEKANEFFR